jgi:hypothetical protein
MEVKRTRPPPAGATARALGCCWHARRHLPTVVLVVLLVGYFLLKINFDELLGIASNELKM